MKKACMDYWIWHVEKSPLIMICCLMMLCGCKPVLIRYKHVVVKESAALKITERSTESNDSQGNPLSAPKVGLPTKCILSAEDYVVLIHTPLNVTPVVFLRAHNKENETLKLQGAHLLKLEETSAVGLDGYTHSFLVEEDRGQGVIDFEVLTKDGIILGHPKIKYDIASRGYVWVIDSI